jgi:predicted phosphoribosyltransferase
MRPLANLKGRSVIVTVDESATGFTTIAVLRVARVKEPAELVAAAPFAPGQIEEARPFLDEGTACAAPRDSLPGLRSGAPAV